MTDIEEMVRGLEAEKVQLDDRKARIDQAIAALQGLDAPAAKGKGNGGRESGTPRRLSAVPSQPRSSSKAAGRKNGKGGASPVPEEILDFAERLWREGKSAAEVAAAVSKKGRPCSVATVYNWSSKNNWKRAKGARANPKEAATPEPVAIAAAVPQPARPRPIAVPQVAVAPKEPKARSALRRCDTCGLTTDKDPCSKCGNRMKSWQGVFSSAASDRPTPEPLVEDRSDVEELEFGENRELEVGAEEVEE